MSLSSHDTAQLRKLITIAESLLASAGETGERAKKLPEGRNIRNKQKRVRRSGRELVSFQKMLKAERKRGVPVAEMARKYGISSAYIYMIK